LNTADDFILGFLDEASPQLNANTQRLWSFNKPVVKKNPSVSNAINGESVVDFKEDSKKESVCEFLEKIRQKNPDKTIIIILDNFRSHRGKKDKKKNEEAEHGSGSSTSLLSRSKSDRRDLESYKENTLPTKTLRRT